MTNKNSPPVRSNCSNYNLSEQAGTVIRTFSVPQPVEMAAAIKTSPSKLARLSESLACRSVWERLHQLNPLRASWHGYQTV